MAENRSKKKKKTKIFSMRLASAMLLNLRTYTSVDPRCQPILTLNHLDLT